MVASELAAYVAVRSRACTVPHSSEGGPSAYASAPTNAATTAASPDATTGLGSGLRGETICGGKGNVVPQRSTEQPAYLFAAGDGTLYGGKLSDDGYGHRTRTGVTTVDAEHFSRQVVREEAGAAEASLDRRGNRAGLGVSFRHRSSL